MDFKDFSSSSFVHAVRKFNRFYINILGLLQQHLLDSDFSLSEARVLYEIGNIEHCTAKSLIDKLRIDAGYLSRILKRFEKYNLAYRTQSEKDGRLYYLYLTDEGKDKLSTLDALSDNQILQMMGDLLDKDQENIAVSMRTIERILSRESQTNRNIDIRSQLLPGDVGRLIHLHGWIYAKECGYNHVFEGYVCKTFYELFQNYRPDKDRFWFAEVDGEMIGAIAIVAHSTMKAQLRWFILHPEFRGVGLGTTLLSEAVQYCREQGYRQVFLETTEDQKTAIHLYKKAGFRKTTEHKSSAWGLQHLEETYELELS